MVPQDYVLGSRNGEHLILRGGDMFVKVDPSKGSHSLATGTQQIPVGIGIPTHRHFFMDEAFYVIEGSGSLILDDVRYPIVKGASIFIPMDSWHGFENASDELVLLWLPSQTCPDKPRSDSASSLEHERQASSRTKDDWVQYGRVSELGFGATISKAHRLCPRSVLTIPSVDARPRATMQQSADPHRR